MERNLSESVEHCDESFVREFQPTTIARVHAKWLASPCFFNENSPQLFWFTGSQYSFNLSLFILSAELAGAIASGRVCENYNHPKVV